MIIDFYVKENLIVIENLVERNLLLARLGSRYYTLMRSLDYRAYFTGIVLTKYQDVASYMKIYRQTQSFASGYSY